MNSGPSGQALHHHNAKNDALAQASIANRMREVASIANTVMAVDLRVDCDVVLPEQVAAEMEAAAWALLRLGAQPAGSPAWREYHAAFLDRYGIEALVPVGRFGDEPVLAAAELVFAAEPTAHRRVTNCPAGPSRPFRTHRRTQRRRHMASPVTRTPGNGQIGYVAHFEDAPDNQCSAKVVQADRINHHLPASWRGRR